MIARNSKLWVLTVRGVNLRVSTSIAVLAVRPPTNPTFWIYACQVETAPTCQSAFSSCHIETWGWRRIGGLAAGLAEPPIHQSSANPPIHQSAANPPIQCQSTRQSTFSEENVLVLLEAPFLEMSKKCMFCLEETQHEK